MDEVTIALLAHSTRSSYEARRVLYEVVRRFADRPDEVRLHDRALTIGNTLTIFGRQWVAVAFEPPVRSDAAARVVLCKMVSQADPSEDRPLEVA